MVRGVNCRKRAISHINKQTLEMVHCIVTMTSLVLVCNCKDTGPGAIKRMLHEFRVALPPHNQAINKYKDCSGIVETVEGDNRGGIVGVVGEEDERDNIGGIAEEVFGHNLGGIVGVVHQDNKWGIAVECKGENVGGISLLPPGKGSIYHDSVISNETEFKNELAKRLVRWSKGPSGRQFTKDLGSGFTIPLQKLLSQLGAVPESTTRLLDDLYEDQQEAAAGRCAEREPADVNLVRTQVQSLQYAQQGDSLLSQPSTVDIETVSEQRGQNSGALGSIVVHVIFVTVTAAVFTA